MPYTYEYGHTVGTAITSGRPNGKIGGGWTLLPLHADARYIYVNNLHPNANDDVNTGFDPNYPLLTPLAGIFKIRPMYGDQVLLAEGTEYDIGHLADNQLYGIKGRNQSYPTAIRSYDPNNPTNTNLMGRAASGDHPILYSDSGEMKWSGGLYLNAHDYIIHQGICFQNRLENTYVDAGKWAKSDYIHWENCVFDRAAHGTSGDSGTDGAVPPDGVYYGPFGYRFCVFFGCWEGSSGRGGSVYLEYANPVIIEDCITWHDAWKIGASRDDPTIDGGPSLQGQGFYLSAKNYHIVRRCIGIDSGHTPFSVRGDTVGSAAFTHNVAIRCPTAGIFGGCSSNAANENPDGVAHTIDEFFAIGGIDVSSSIPRTNGLNFNNQSAGLLKRAYFLHTQPIMYKAAAYVSVESSNGIGVGGDPNPPPGYGTQLIPTTVAVEDCVGQLFSTQLRTTATHYNETMYLSYTNCRFADPVVFEATTDDAVVESFGEGNLTGSAALATFPDPYVDEADFHADHGFASYDEHLAYLMANVTQPNVENIFTKAAPRYGLTTSFTTDSEPEPEPTTGNIPISVAVMVL